jgi:hypothetical protein
MPGLVDLMPTPARLEDVIGSPGLIGPFSVET